VLPEPDALPEVPLLPLPLPLMIVARFPTVLLLGYYSELKGRSTPHKPSAWKSKFLVPPFFVRFSITDNNTKSLQDPPVRVRRAADESTSKDFQFYLPRAPAGRFKVVHAFKHGTAPVTTCCHDQSEHFQLGLSRDREEKEATSYGSEALVRFFNCGAVYRLKQCELLPRSRC